MDLPWYAEKLVLPAAFTLLGAIIGFVSALAKDHLDARRARTTFLRAINLELAGLEEQLRASLEETTQGLERYRTQRGIPPLLLGTLRNTVFATQLGKLKDLDSPLILDVVKFYSDLMVLERMLEEQGKLSNELTKSVGSQSQAQLSSALMSVLTALQNKISGFIGRVQSLRRELP